MVFFRKIFILQLVGLVLTYNFTDCDFEKIKKRYHYVIYPALKEYMNGTKSTKFNSISCKDPPDCLTKIEQINFNPTHGCPSLAKEIFAIRTNATLILQCPGYYGIQINTQAMKKRKNREVTTNKCLEHVSYLIYLWHRFSRIS
ncbi:Thymic Stromal Lymphopoietin [Manis pentadactyla]|nr:Thymic Stromal Lymphopoietin [Manis pentadactyla]